MKCTRTITVTYDDDIDLVSYLNIAEISIDKEGNDFFNQVLAEREKQRKWVNDDMHVNNELVNAAITYVCNDSAHWPWHDIGPGMTLPNLQCSPTRRFVKAFALLLAEYERQTAVVTLKLTAADFFRIIAAVTSSIGDKLQGSVIGQ